MTSTETDASGEGEPMDASEAVDAAEPVPGPDEEPLDHGGVIDLERLPGGSRLTAIRADLVKQYRGYLELDPADKESVNRWGLGSIVSHWLLVTCMLAAVVTGLAIWTGVYGPLDLGIWDGYQVSFQIHVWAGVVLAVLALLVFPFYHKVVDGHHLLVSWSQLKEQLVIGLAFVGLVRYIPGYKQARRAYDEDEEEWVGYHPTQTVFWYVTWFFVLLLTLTGFALWKGLSTQPAWWLETLGFMQGWFAPETLLQLHLIGTFWVVAAVAVHVYIAILPGNRDFLRSMFGGTVKAWVVDSESRPDAVREESTDGSTAPEEVDVEDD